MRRTLRIAGIIALGLISLLLIGGWIYSEPRPVGTAGPEADALAQKMQTAINRTAWDKTRYLRWSFPGGHDYVWDKHAGLVQVKWGSKEVLLRTNDQSGRAWNSEQELKGENAEKAIQEAWGYFCNDSFWLNAPAKAFDPGTSRQIVNKDDGTQALLVSYESGGVTPGDAYLWHLDETGKPTRYEMWVSIIPIGGLDATWEDWTTLASGANVAIAHDLGVYKMSLGDVKGGNALQDIALDVNPFDALKSKK